MQRNFKKRSGYAETNSTSDIARHHMVLSLSRPLASLLSTAGMSQGINERLIAKVHGTPLKNLQWSCKVDCCFIDVNKINHEVSLCQTLLTHAKETDAKLLTQLLA